MRLHVAQPVVDLFPAITLGVLTGTISAPRGDVRGTVAALRDKASASLLAGAPTVEALAEHPHVSRWREAYRAFGTKPNKHRPTHEALARRLLKDGVWPEINPIVDVYLTNQIEHLLPHGGYDRAALAGDLALYVSPGNEGFEPLGGGSELTEAGEIVYRDERRVLTRRWNYKDCDATKIEAATSAFLLFIEAPGGIDPARVEAACADLAGRYERAFDGDFRAAVFSVDASCRDLPID